MRMRPVSRAMLGCGLVLLLSACLGMAQQPETKQPPLPDGLRHVPPDALGFIHVRTGDFLSGKWIFDLPELFSALELIARFLYCGVLIVYGLRSVYQWTHGRANPGKDIVVLTTVVCWYAGIVAFNSDYAFTVTNVVIHGIPYFVLVFVYWRAKQAHQGKKVSSTWRMVLVFLATLWLLAYVEELVWDRGHWGERAWLFGKGWESGMGERALLGR